MQKDLLPLEELKRQIREYGYIPNLWGVEDVFGCMDNQRDDFIFSEEDARTVLFDMEYGHDASIGINWDVIDARIWDYFYDRPYNNKNKTEELVNECGFILEDPEVQISGIILHLEVAHREDELNEKRFKEVVTKYLEAQKHSALDKFEIHYVEKDIKQIKTLIRHADHVDIIKPSSIRKEEIEIDLRDKKFKKNKVKVAEHEAELALINVALSYFNFEYFTEKSPIYRAIKTGYLELPDTQGGEHEAVILKL